jgi:flavoprotein
MQVHVCAGCTEVPPEFSLMGRKEVEIRLKNKNAQLYRELSEIKTVTRIKLVCIMCELIA